MDITIVMLHYKRPLDNLKIIIDRLMTKPDKSLREIVIFNNDPGVKLGQKYRGATVINAGRNFFVPIRHALAIALESTHYLFVDDDISISPATVGVFREWTGKFPEAVLGLFGMRLAVSSKEPYTDGKHLNSKTRPKGPAEVDVVVGRVHFCRADKLVQSFWWRTHISGFPGKHHLTRVGEDIILSLANRFAGHKNFLIPLGQGVEFQELSEGTFSVCKTGEHWGQRNRAVLDMMQAYGAGYENTLGF